jgi:hypothetical protein
MWSARPGVRLAHQRGCRPIYARAFGAAAKIVAERIKTEEKYEREACAEAGLDFKPSEFLWTLCNLAARYQTEAEGYGQEPISGDTPILPAPAHALGDLWPNIVREAKQ